MIHVKKHNKKKRKKEKRLNDSDPHFSLLHNATENSPICSIYYISMKVYIVNVDKADFNLQNSLHMLPHWGCENRIVELWCPGG